LLGFFPRFPEFALQPADLFFQRGDLLGFRELDFFFRHASCFLARS
jgi:hypothetical protein